MYQPVLSKSHIHGKQILFPTLSNLYMVSAFFHMHSYILSISSHAFSIVCVLPCSISSIASSSLEKRIFMASSTVCILPRLSAICIVSINFTLSTFFYENSIPHFLGFHYDFKNFAASGVSIQQPRRARSTLMDKKSHYPLISRSSVMSFSLT